MTLLPFMLRLGFGLVALALLPATIHAQTLGGPVNKDAKGLGMLGVPPGTAPGTTPRPAGHLGISGTPAVPPPGSGGTSFGGGCHGGSFSGFSGGSPGGISPGVPAGGNLGGGFNFGGGFNLGGLALPSVDPATPVHKLIPAAPRFKTSAPYLGIDLDEMPEVGLAEPFRHEGASLPELMKVYAHALHLQKNGPDGFLEALLEHRPDLGGLPFLPGEAARPSAVAMRQFENLRTMVAASIHKGEPGKEDSFSLGSPTLFWKNLRERFAKVSDSHDVRKAKVAVLTQMCAPETAAIQKDLIKTLAEIRSKDSSQALARMVLFAPDKQLRDSALMALRGRAAGEYADVFLNGLRYPWPPAADRAAQALVRLQRKELIANVVDLLDGPDPRLPRTVEAWGQPVTVVRELVKINHHRNCMLCHPALPQETSPPAKTPLFMAAHPLPGFPLGGSPSLGGFGYFGGSFGGPRGPQVAFDVTYLRQDFSLMQRVEKDEPWPLMQRFDFLVRERAVDEEEVERIRAGLASAELTPHQRAADAALRGLTGLSAAPDAASWRRALAERETK